MTTRPLVTAAYIATSEIVHPRKAPYIPPPVPQPKQRQLAPVADIGPVLGKPDLMEIHVLDSDMDEGLPEEAGWLQVQHNPPEVGEVVKANWPRLSILGMSHQRQYYQMTETVPFRFELRFDALEYFEQAKGAGGVMAGVKRVNLAERFLRSLAFPTVVTGAPPRFLLYYPNFIALTAKLDELSFKFERNAQTGHVMRFAAAVGLSEIRDVRLTRAQVFEQGNLRAT